MDSKIHEQLRAFLENERYEEFVKAAQSYLSEKDKTLLQIVLTQKARLQEIDNEILMRQLEGDDITEARAHVRGALSYVLHQLTQYE